MQEETADKIENYLKTTFSKVSLIKDKPNLPWLWIVQVLMIVVFVLNFISLLQRSDFPTVNLILK